jgi:hypothetical protein
MGWYTELEIGKENWSWRKYLPYDIPILFFGKHKVIGRELIKNQDSENYDKKFIGFVATVNQVKKNLDELGMTINFFASLYSSYRNGFIPFIEGYHSAVIEMSEEVKKRKKQGKKDDWLDSYLNNERLKYSKTVIKQLFEGDAMDELKNSIEFLKSGRKIELSREPDDYYFIPAITEFKYENKDREIGDIKTGIFGEFVSYARKNLPEVARILEIRLYLETLSPNTKVKLNLNEWVFEGGELDGVIENTVETLTLKAKGYARAFDTLMGNSKTQKVEYLRSKLVENWQSIFEEEITNYEKGRRLENLVANIFSGIGGIDVISMNLATETQELDIVLKNKINSPFFISLSSPFIFIECKNWNTKVGTKEARIFESKLRQSTNRANIGIFVAVNGVTKGFQAHINTLKRDGVNIVLITNKDIDNLILDQDFEIETWFENIIARELISSG